MIAPAFFYNYNSHAGPGKALPRGRFVYRAGGRKEKWKKFTIKSY